MKSFETMLEFCQAYDKILHYFFSIRRQLWQINFLERTVFAAKQIFFR